MEKIIEQIRAIAKRFWLSVVALIAGWFAGLNLGPAPEVLAPAPAPVEEFRIASEIDYVARAEAETLRADLAATQGRLAAICAGHVGEDRWKAECGEK